MLFCAFGSVAPPCPFDPSPLPPAPLLLRLHPPCIPLALWLFFPFAFRSHSVFIPSITLCVSGCRGVGSGVSGRGCRAGGVGSGVSGRLCSPCPSPSLMRTDSPSPPLPPHTPRVGGCKVCGCSPEGAQPLFSPLTSAVGQLLSDCSDTSLYSGMWIASIRSHGRDETTSSFDCVPLWGRIYALHALSFLLP